MPRRRSGRSQLLQAGGFTSTFHGITGAPLASGAAAQLSHTTGLSCVSLYATDVTFANLFSTSFTNAIAQYRKWKLHRMRWRWVPVAPTNITGIISSSVDLDPTVAATGSLGANVSQVTGFVTTATGAVGPWVTFIPRDARWMLTSVGSISGTTAQDDLSYGVIQTVSAQAPTGTTSLGFLEFMIDVTFSGTN